MTAPNDFFADFLYSPAHHECQAPPFILRPFVERLWVARDAGGKRVRVIPDGCIDIRLDRTDPRGCVIVGPFTQCSTIHPTKPYEFVGARFHPLGASALLKLPLQEMQNCRVPLADVLNDAGELMDSVAAAPSLSAAALALARYLSARAPSAPSQHRAATVAVSALIQRRGSIAVAALAERLGVSRQYLNTLFIERIGFGPKVFSRIMRFRGLLAGNGWTNGSWAERAHAAGYYDQAHMIAEFKQFAGVTPEQYQLIRGTHTQAAA